MASDDAETHARKLKRWQASGAPVQREYSGSGSRVTNPFPLRIPWHFHERAWSVYAAAGHGDQSAVRLAERGGFGVLEIVACLALGNYRANYKQITAEHVATVRAEIEEWTSGNHAVRAERDAAIAQACSAIERSTAATLELVEAERERGCARSEVARMRSSLETLADHHDGNPEMGWIASELGSVLAATEEDHPHDELEVQRDDALARAEKAEAALRDALGAEERAVAQWADLRAAVRALSEKWREKRPRSNVLAAARSGQRERCANELAAALGSET